MAMHTYWITRTITDENGPIIPPGDIIQESLDELNVSLREFARAMEIAPSTAKPIADRKSSFDARNGNKTFRGDRQFAANVAESAKCPSLAEAEKRWMCRDCAVWLRNKNGAS